MSGGESPFRPPRSSAKALMHETNKNSNNGFWELPASERAERMHEATMRGGVGNFFDLPPEDRAQAYENRRD